MLPKQSRNVIRKKPYHNKVEIIQKYLNEHNNKVTQ